VKRHLAGLLFLALSAACADAQDAFTDGRAAKDCSGALPVCSATAGCVLDNQSYASGSFQQGGTLRAIVRTDGAADVEVALFFRTELSPGTDTEIAWYEVGCRQRFAADNAGRDVFVEAGQDRLFKRTQRITTAGDHLIEVFSDAQADVLYKVTVKGAQ
jgi:hypothetical protein